MHFYLYEETASRCLPAEPPRPGLQMENAIAIGESDLHANVIFRCHAGHACSFKALLAEVKGTVDGSLWNES